MESLIVVHLVERRPVGTTFPRLRVAWPLHITLLPWFEVEDSRTADLLSAIERYAKSLRKFVAVVGDTENFGPGKDIPVNLIVDQQPIAKMHDDLLDLTKQHGALLSSQANALSSAAGRKYRAHITHHVVNGTVHRRFPGDKETFADITVARLFDKDGGQMCEIVKHFEFEQGGQI